MKLSKNELKGIIKEAYGEVLQEQQVYNVLDEDARKLALLGEAVLIKGTQLINIDGDINRIVRESVNKTLMSEAAAAASTAGKILPWLGKAGKNLAGWTGKYILAPLGLGAGVAGGVGYTASKIGKDLLLPIGMAGAAGVGMTYLKNQGDKEKTKADLKRYASQAGGRIATGTKKAAKGAVALGKKGIEMSKAEYKEYMKEKERQRKEAEKALDSSDLEFDSFQYVKGDDGKTYRVRQTKGPNESLNLKIPRKSIQYINETSIEELSHLIVLGAKAKDVLRETNQYSYKPVLTENNQLHVEDLAFVLMNETMDNVTETTNQIDELSLKKMLTRGAIGAGLGYLGGQFGGNYMSDTGYKAASDDYTPAVGKPGDADYKPQVGTAAVGSPDDPSRLTKFVYEPTGGTGKEDDPYTWTEPEKGWAASDDYEPEVGTAGKGVEGDDDYEAPSADYKPAVGYAGAKEKAPIFGKKRSDYAKYISDPKQAAKSGAIAGGSIGALSGAFADDDDDDDAARRKGWEDKNLGEEELEELQSPQLMMLGTASKKISQIAADRIDKKYDQDDAYEKGFKAGKKAGKKGKRMAAPYTEAIDKAKYYEEVFGLNEYSSILKEMRADKINENISRKVTIKEISKWLGRLEENKYKKTYINDAKRIAWLVNNKLSEDYSKMPSRIQRKTEGVSYARERYLAKEYIKHINSKQIKEVGSEGIEEIGVPAVTQGPSQLAVATAKLTKNLPDSEKQKVVTALNKHYNNPTTLKQFAKAGKTEADINKIGSEIMKGLGMGK